MRLFVGVWPPSEVCDRIAGLERPDVPGVRWTTPDQWHVTLRFLGELPEAWVAGLRTALVRVATRVAAPPEAVLGPAVTLLGRSVLCVPVAGLDEVAAAVGALCTPHGTEALASPFVGHLTLARGRGRRPVPRGLAGAPLGARWRVDELCLVSSVPRPGGARYATLATATVPS